MHRLLFAFSLWWAAVLYAAAQGQPGHADAPAAASETQHAGNDSVKVSLLTVTPGQKSYELYGHTALRVREVYAHRSSDWVFNYGTFSFSQPHFVWRFVKGETDYELGVVPYTLFYHTYLAEGRGIDEQVLNLTPDECRKLVDALSENLLPENATYRYSFFYNNCTTRAIDMIEAAIDGKVVWPQADADKSLRDIVDEYAQTDPWLQLGQNLLLGAEADKPADRKAQGFAPLYAERFVEQARIVDSKGHTRRLAEETRTLLPAAYSRPEQTASPVAALACLLALLAVATLVEWRRHAWWWGIDALLLLLQGLAGLSIGFMFCCSEHPTVDSNWLVLLFNPLPLLYLPWFMKQASMRRTPRGYYGQGVLLAALLLAALAGVQQFPAALWTLWGMLALRWASFAAKQAAGRPASPKG
ncbi:MAG: DUF4105 domain-containing protein [Bacteroidales bacterium]|nr:DUF4105 domain-containing protein [Bacteroidales bacterium]